MKKFIFNPFQDRSLPPQTTQGARTFSHGDFMSPLTFAVCVSARHSKYHGIDTLNASLKVASQ